MDVDDNIAVIVILLTLNRLTANK